MKSDFIATIAACCLERGWRESLNSVNRFDETSERLTMRGLRSPFSILESRCSHRLLLPASTIFSPTRRARTPGPIRRPDSGVPVTPLEIGPSIDNDGYFTEAVASGTGRFPGSSRSRRWAQSDRRGTDALMADIFISVATPSSPTPSASSCANLRWDGEEAPARLVGDIAAHRTVNVARNVVAWHRQTALNVVENLAEYFGEEQPLLVKRPALEDLAGTSTKLRDDLARLDKRLRKLEALKPLGIETQQPSLALATQPKKPG